MKRKKYFAWLEVYLDARNISKKEIGIYSAFSSKEAKIHAQSDAIKMGCDYKLVKVKEIK